MIDVFLDDLDLSGLGFKTQPNETGRPAYHPSTMLKLFAYGYLNQVHSSRRLDRNPDAMRIRRATVEHPFGTLKAWIGSTHFLTKTLDRVNTEMSLHVLAYNMKRMMNIIGTKPLIEAIRA